MTHKIINFIRSMSARQEREYDRRARDFSRHRIFRADGEPRVVTMGEVRYRTRRVLENARRRGDIPPKIGPMAVEQRENVQSQGGISSKS